MMGAGGEVTEKQQEFIDVILNNVNRMSDLVTDLLDSSRIESGRIQFAQRSVPLSKIVRDSVNSVRTQIEARKHELIVEIPDDLPNVRADPGRMMQVMINLLSNAFKYTPDGGRITIRAQIIEGQDGADQEIELVFADTGVGIDPRDHELIFDKFFRAYDPKLHSTGSTKFMGAGPGLGLAIVRGIVQAHGGRIWVESSGHDPDRCPGSEFHVVLPLKASQPVAGVHSNAVQGAL